MQAASITSPPPRTWRADKRSPDIHFAGSLDYESTAKDLQRIVKTKKTELLFMALFLRLLQTGGRAAVIVPDGVLFGSSNAHQQIRTELHPYLAGTLDKIDCPSLRVGGVADHVHLFFGLSRTRTIAEVVETVKTSSSKWIKSKGPEFSGFHWQSGYGAFSVSQSDADTVVNYVANQESHHRKMTFKDEYRKLLERYRINYDETYVWD